MHTCIRVAARNKSHLSERLKYYFETALLYWCVLGQLSSFGSNTKILVFGRLKLVVQMQVFTYLLLIGTSRPEIGIPCSEIGTRHSKNTNTEHKIEQIYPDRPASATKEPR